MKTLTGFHAAKTPIISLAATHADGMAAFPYITLGRVNCTKMEDGEFIIDVMFGAGCVRITCGEAAVEELFGAARNTCLDSVEKCDDGRFVRAVEIIERKKKGASEGDENDEEGGESNDND